MSDEGPNLILILAWSLAACGLTVAGWVLAKARQPCPHCGRRAERTIRNVHTLAGGPRDLIYACRSCNGTLRYARRPDGREFWEPIEGPTGGPS